MRVIAGHDYYDTGMGLGHDESLIFVRSRATEWSDDEAREAGFQGVFGRFTFSRPDDRSLSSLYSGRSSFGSGNDCFHAFSVKAYVCGKVYRGVAVDGPGTASGLLNGHWVGAGVPRQVFWDWQSFAAFLRSFRLEARYGSSTWEPGTSGAAEAFFTRSEASRREIERLASARITLLTHVPEPMSRVGVKPWRINGDNLKAIQFYKVMDAYTVFQEIEMWVGGVLAASGNAMVQITDDKVKIAKHGFDVVRSFRKARSA